MRRGVDTDQIYENGFKDVLSESVLKIGFTIKQGAPVIKIKG